MREGKETKEEGSSESAPLMSITYSPKAFGELIGRTTNTLQQWDRDGKLHAHRSPISNRRFYTHDQYLEYMGRKAEMQGLKIAYARVSTRAQKPDLLNQIQALQQHSLEHAIEIDEYMQDIGSGLNYKRKKFNRLMELVEHGRVAIILIAYRDRLVRFGFEWFEAFCERHGTKIIMLNAKSLSPEKEMIEDLLVIVTIFAARFHGLRSYKKAIAEKLGKEKEQGSEDNRFKDAEKE
jgi:putative resolvase